MTRIAEESFSYAYWPLGNIKLSKKDIFVDGSKKRRSFTRFACNHVYRSTFYGASGTALQN